MNRFKKTLTSFCIVCIALAMFNNSIVAQSPDYFRNPLDIPITLAANFGEIRSNHFHTGFDIRTNAEIGYKVYAAADGVISRIKVSAGGFGNVLYITHPNGYMTVYAHLDHFNDAIAAYVKQQQYAKQSFEVELFPEASKFPVRKSDLIAYSGNSGASGGPHLHFEIRDASGETYPLNPAAFYKLEDTIAPKITAAYIYGIEKTTGIPVKYAVKKIKSGYTLAKDSVVVNNAMVGVAVEAADYMNRASNDYGVFEFTVKLDGKQIYNVKFDKFDFANGRYVNAFTDYKAIKTSDKTIQRLFRLPGDHNTIYHDLVNDGKISFTDSLFHLVEVMAADAYQNTTTLSFHVKGNHVTKAVPATTEEGRVFHYNQPNTFTSDSIQLNLPANILYEDLTFSYVEIPSAAKRYSATHVVQNANIPVHDSYEIRILPRNISTTLQPKAVIAYDEGKGVSGTKTSHWDGKWLVARAREFGYFYVMLDTTAPKITPVNVKQNSLLTTNNIKFTISDNLSGIVAYKGLLDGKWILMEYDPKNKRLQCTLDKQLAPGEHSLKITVADDVKNESVYLLKFKK
ncbi:MAG: M23 family metallopeptidase [Chitinophagaceae bacterium]|nr:M23 family metallopeptidase [Chitinophagaceae bacterium]